MNNAKMRVTIDKEYDRLERGHRFTLRVELNQARVVGTVLSDLAYPRPAYQCEAEADALNRLVDHMTADFRRDLAEQVKAAIMSAPRTTYSNY